MRFVHPSRWPLPLIAGALIGLAFGFASVQLQLALLTHGYRAGLAVMFVINVVLPIAAGLLAAYYPRAPVSHLAGALLGIGYFVGVLVSREPRFWLWTADSAIGQLHPILVVSTLGYICIAHLLAMLSVSWRRVGLPDASLRCKRCGYLLNDVKANVCPECCTFRVRHPRS